MLRNEPDCVALRKSYREKLKQAGKAGRQGVDEKHQSLPPSTSAGLPGFVSSVLGAVPSVGAEVLSARHLDSEASLPRGSHSRSLLESGQGSGASEIAVSVAHKYFVFSRLKLFQKTT